MKHCSHCKQSKPLTEFSRNRSCPDGYAYQCKRCKNELAKRSRAKADRVNGDRARGERVNGDKFSGIGRTFLDDLYAPIFPLPEKTEDNTVIQLDRPERSIELHKSDRNWVRPVTVVESAYPAPGGW